MHLGKGRIKEKKQMIKGEKKETERETNEGEKQGLSSSMKDRRRWTGGRKG